MSQRRVQELLELVDLWLYRLGPLLYCPGGCSSACNREALMIARAAAV